MCCATFEIGEVSWCFFCCCVSWCCVWSW